METLMPHERKLENDTKIKEIFLANRIAELHSLSNVPKWERENEGTEPASKQALEIAERYTREMIEYYPQDIEYSLGIDGDVCMSYPDRHYGVYITCRTNGEVSIRILSYGDWLFDKDIEYEKEGNMYIVEKLKDVIHSLEPNK